MRIGGKSIPSRRRSSGRGPWWWNWGTEEGHGGWSKGAVREPCLARWARRPWTPWRAWAEELHDLHYPREHAFWLSGGSRLLLGWGDACCSEGRDGKVGSAGTFSG